jgi:hypothetical protein
MNPDTFNSSLALLGLTLGSMLLSIYIIIDKACRKKTLQTVVVQEEPETDITLSELNYIKAELNYYREEKEVCEEKMRSSTLTLEGYNTLRKYWEGLSNMIEELEEIVA